MSSINQKELIKQLKKYDRSILIVICRKLGLTKTTLKTNQDLRKWILSATMTKNQKEIEWIRQYLPSVTNIVQRSGKQIKSKKRNNQQNTSKESNLSMKQKPTFFPPVQRLIAIGDLHGDLEATILSLQKAKVISPDISNHEKDITKIHWTGGKTFVVQLGDQIDRVRPSELYQNLCKPNDPELICDEGNDLKIMCLFDQLDKEAKTHGGRCISIIGNHELMNVDGDFRYVSPKEFSEFGSYFNGSRSHKNTNVPYGYAERKNAFCPGGVLARRIGAYRYAIVQVGSWLFVHGALHPEVAKKYPLSKINKTISNWLLNIEKESTFPDIQFLYHNENDAISPFWSRIYSDHDEFTSNRKKDFYTTLEHVNSVNKTEQHIPAKGMIVGHSPQFMYGKSMNCDMNGYLWRVDVGVSRAFGKHEKSRFANLRKVQILEILDDTKSIQILS